MRNSHIEKPDVTKTKKEICGGIFIIPNRLTGWNSSLTKCSGYQLSQWANYARMLPEGVSLEDSKPIQVWMYTDGNSNSNWYDHGIDGYPELEDFYPAVDFIPSEIFKDLKEGDSITIDLPIETRPWLTKDKFKKSGIIKVKLTLSQLKTRYARFGTFEKVLKSVAF